MWQYTTETIINKNVGHLPGDVRFGVYPSTPPKTDFDKPLTTATAGDEVVFLIDGVQSAFNSNSINAIYHAGWEEEKKAKGTFTVPATGYSVGDVLRLKVVLRQKGMNSAAFQNAYLRHNKPFFFEVVVESAEADKIAEKLAEKLVTAVNNQMHLSEKYFSISAAAGVVTIEVLDCYTHIIEVSLAKVGAAANSGEQLTGFDDYTPLDIKWSESVHSNPGLGNVRQLVMNHRVPTATSISPFAADQGGKPIPGGKYDMYTIEIVTDRRHVGNQVMGALDRSITTHVFYIEEGAKKDWDAALAVLKVANANLAVKEAKGANVQNDEFVKKDPKIGSVE